MIYCSIVAVLAGVSAAGICKPAAIIGMYIYFAGYSGFSKVLLTFTMLLGRLEILPVLILFNKRTWKRI